MSSLFLRGTVFVEVRLVDVGIAEEYSKPVNRSCRGCVDRRSDVLYDLYKNMMTRKSMTQNPGDNSYSRGSRDRRPGVLYDL